MIDINLLKKYRLATLEDLYKIQGISQDTNLNFYKNFLSATDYLAMKLAEGLITREDKKEEFDARDFARAEINRLQAEK